MGKLTQKQRKFCDLYIETGNATQSYIDAGYKATSNNVAYANAKQLLEKHSVKNFLHERTKQLDEEAIASQNEILKFLTSVVRGEITEQIPVTMKDTWEMADKEPSIKDRVKAAEQIGKRYAMWTDKQQIDGTVPVTIVDDLDD